MENHLIGGWRLVRWEITYDDCRPPTNPLGPDATGLIAYTPDGWMNASMAPMISTLRGSR